MADSTSIPKWKSITTSRDNPAVIDRALKRLDMQNQNATDATIDVLQTIETNITNITNGTTTVYAKWSSWHGLIIPWGIIWIFLGAICHA